MTGNLGPYAASKCDADSVATVSILDGSCRCIICARCGHHTGNSHQGHHWNWCSVTKSMREPYFCCPDDCELEAESASDEGGAS